MSAPTTNSVGFASVKAITNPPPALFLHLAIFLDNRDIVGDETFRLVSFSGTEQVSEPFEFQLELHGNDRALISDLVYYHDPGFGSGRTLTFDQLMGKPVTFAVSLPLPEQEVTKQDDTYITLSSDRFQQALAGGTSEGLSLFNGIVAGFAMAAPGVYHLTVKPALWRLTLANRYEVYDDMSVRQAIEAVLAKHHITPDTAAVAGLAEARIQDWLQAGESDYEFLRRLMSKSHLYFYFRHSAREHKLVLANRPEYPEALPGHTLRYTFTDNQENGLSRFDVISDYRYQQNLAITGVHTVFTRQDEGWQVDGVPPIHQFDIPPPPEQDSPTVFQQHKVYQYGSGKSAAREFSRLTEQASRTASSQLSGQSYCAAFHVGHRFSMTEQGSQSAPMPVRPSLDNRPFVLTKVEHQASLDGGYQNTFEATETDGLIAAFSMSDTQQGSVLAIVVDHGTPKSWKYYEKTDFDPETQRYTDTDSADQGVLQAQGVYVRFATDPEGTRRWVKLAAHMQSAPEIGAQVMIGRAGDESELPELAQIVQAGGSKVVTPAKWTANTSVGSSYGTRYGDGINIGFGKSSEANLDRAVNIATTAYDSNRFREASYGQGASYSFSTAESTASSASQDLATTYGPYGPASDLLGVNESFGSSFGRSKGQVSSSIAEHDISYSKSTFGKTESYSTIQGTAYSETTHQGLITNKTTITADSVSTTTQTGNTTDTRTHTGNATSTTTQNGNTTNTTTLSGTSTNTSTITKQVNTNNITTSESTDTIGSQTSTTTVGSATQTSVTGTHLGTQVTGASLSTTVAGTSTSVSVVGNNNSVSVMGLTSDFSILGAGITYKVAGAVLEGKTVLLEIELPAIFKIVL